MDTKCESNQKFEIYNQENETLKKLVDLGLCGQMDSAAISKDYAKPAAWHGS
jgi:hypothetical protein